MLGLTLIAIARYLFSGIRNGEIYAHKYPKAAASTLVVLLCLYCTGYKCIVSEGWSTPDWQYRSVLHVFITTTQIGCVALSAIASLLVLVTRSKNKYIADLHLKTTLESIFFSGLCAVSGLVPLLACLFAVYPGVILQKIAINLLSGLPWNAEKTDDETGRTYGIPSLGIKIPRLNFQKRIILATISIVAAIIYHFNFF